jgi:hypothetical protein
MWECRLPVHSDMTDMTASRWAGLLVLAGALALAAGMWVRHRAVTPAPVAAALVAPTALPIAARRAQAEFGATAVSADVRRIAGWAAEGGDAQGRPFMIIDKQAAEVHVFDATGRLTGTAPVLLGSARGDHSVPGIGQRAIADVRPFERTTPAGRFVTAPGRNLNGEQIVWIDYEAAVSMHRVRATVARERRLARLASASAADNRISYGCINVPVSFYEAVVWPAFSLTPAIAYVLPDKKSLHEVFVGLPEAVDSAQAVPASLHPAAS